MTQEFILRDKWLTFIWNDSFETKQKVFEIITKFSKIIYSNKFSHHHANDSFHKDVFNKKKKSVLIVLYEMII